MSSSSSSSSSFSRVALVTGANKGIGLEIVRQLASADPHLLVLLGSRDSARGEQAATKLQLPNVRSFTIDVSSQASIDAAAKIFAAEYPQGLSLLVNNAGVYLTQDDTAGKKEVIDETFAVNYYGAKNTYLSFAPLLAKDARVVNVSSQMSAMGLKALSPEHRAAILSADLTVAQLEQMLTDFRSAGAEGVAKGWGNSAYCFSKLAVSTLTRLLARETKSGVTIHSACPGWCQTDMTAGMPAPLSSEEGGSRIVYVCTLPSGDAESNNGAFWEERKVSHALDA